MVEGLVVFALVSAPSFLSAISPIFIPPLSFSFCYFSVFFLLSTSSSISFSPSCPSIFMGSSSTSDPSSFFCFSLASQSTSPTYPLLSNPSPSFLPLLTYSSLPLSHLRLSLSSLVQSLLSLSLSLSLFSFSLLSSSLCLLFFFFFWSPLSILSLLYLPRFILSFSPLSFVFYPTFSPISFSHDAFSLSPFSLLLKVSLFFLLLFALSIFCLRPISFFFLPSFSACYSLHTFSLLYISEFLLPSTFSFPFRCLLLSFFSRSYSLSLFASFSSSFSPDVHCALPFSFLSRLYFLFNTPPSPSLLCISSFSSRDSPFRLSLIYFFSLFPPVLKPPLSLLLLSPPSPFLSPFLRDKPRSPSPLILPFSFPSSLFSLFSLSLSFSPLLSSLSLLLPPLSPLPFSNSLPLSLLPFYPPFLSPLPSLSFSLFYPPFPSPSSPSHHPCTRKHFPLTPLSPLLLLSSSSPLYLLLSGSLFPSSFTCFTLSPSPPISLPPSLLLPSPSPPPSSSPLLPRLPLLPPFLPFSPLPPRRLTLPSLPPSLRLLSPPALPPSIARVPLRDPGFAPSSSFPFLPPSLSLYSPPFSLLPSPSLPPSPPSLLPVTSLLPS
ncbi:hypothetical protein C7M84_011584 [Penaeus vannamei]|uniref:Uncharacterized protein n=1 Tax=Penaeus vannamei TaxID=6689 RepID=A0A3R7MUN5_PENVA|nr:hypothetical protein C7M84_011584 [Penaeus vannamei]